MAENPYAAPQSAPTGEVRSLDLGEAFSAGTTAFTRNWLTWTGVTVVGGVLVGLSMLLCLVPALIVWPAIQWGMNRFALEALDGEPGFDRMMSGFEDVGRSVPPMLLLGLVFLLLQMPLQIVSFGIGFVADPDPTSQLVVSLFTTGLSVVYQAIFWTRFSLSGMFIVERGLPATEAMSASWEATGRSWVMLALLNILCSVLMFMGIIGCFVGLFVTSSWAVAIQAAAYRQLSPRQGAA